MTIVEGTRSITGGVDTHLDVHVAAAVDFAAENPAAPWNVCRTEVYYGTRLYSRLESEGRLLGSFPFPAYRMADRRSELAFRLARLFNTPIENLFLYTEEEDHE